MNPPVSLQMWQPYGLSHWSLLGLTSVGAVLLVRLGRSHRGTAAADRFSRGFGLALFGVAFAWIGWNVLPGHLHADTSLPLHLCDVLRFVAGYALITRARWAVAATYYWGLTLDPQAMLTPSLVYSTVPAVDFTAYWLQHILVVWSVFYLIWGLGERPTWRSYRIAVLLIIGWAAGTFAINLVLGADYGYLNRKPPMASLLDVFGPWPYYLLVEFIVALSLWALITLPWTLRKPRSAVTPAVDAVRIPGSEVLD
ncbi:MAG: TIGR02206 family membrane protein [Microlunatus sp.]|nr:TIGR02206 family membrane protein [Microlunatus sp.]